MAAVDSARDNRVTMTDTEPEHPTLVRLGMFPLSAVLYPTRRFPSTYSARVIGP